jgi:polar amino acid transport system substrate-binding protein
MMRAPAKIAIGFFALSQVIAVRAEDTAPYDVPLYRHVEELKKPPPAEGLSTIRLLTDEDFPPYSYRDANGGVTGLNVELALGVCSELALACEIVAKPWAQLRPALDSGEGNAIISGMRLTAESAEGLDTTRAFFRAAGRFAVRHDSEIGEVTPNQLAGRKIGAVEGSGHAAWLKRYFPKSEIVTFAATAEARAGLKNGKTDLLFADGVDLVFWLNGEDSAKCCKLVPGAFVDSNYFSNAMFYVVRRGDTPLRRLLDHGLDRMQTSGRFAEIFRRYVPASPW